MDTPAANRKVLVFLAGIVWSLVGLGLILAAVNWLTSAKGDVVYAVTAGIIIGGAIYYFGFSRLAAVNLTRIYTQAPGKDKVCIFAFQNKRSYYIVIIMILMGYTLRHLPIDKIYLSPVYLAIGLGLFLASLRYYRRLTRQ
ncbi:MAG TPA: hypothetical protein ENH25_09185 [candidate division Zixibacteria bacterium]|nr:hypothetical protein [candidate division Zixibacteria bacterium]